MNIFTLFAHSAFDNLVQASESSLYVKYFQFQNRNNFLKDGTIFQSLNVLPSTWTCISPNLQTHQP